MAAYPHETNIDRLVEMLRQKTGLSALTVTELLANGWRYVEKQGEIGRWEHPMWALEAKRVDRG